MSLALKELHRRLPGFNEVTGHFTPNGELILELSHKNCNDQDVLIRLNDAEDILFTDDVDWEDDNTLAGRINHGGNWND